MFTEEYKKDSIKNLREDSPEEVLRKLEDAIGVYSNYAFSEDAKKKRNLIENLILG